MSKLRAKPDAGSLRVVIGNFADVAISGSFALIYAVFNTFFMLPDIEEQVRCFANVADRLSPGGAFVIEGMVPDLTMYDRGQRIHVHDIQPDRVWLETSRYDAVTQRVTSQNVLLTAHGARFYPAQLRIASPSELDLMARLAGLALETRWGGWWSRVDISQTSSLSPVSRENRDC